MLKLVVRDITTVIIKVKKVLKQKLLGGGKFLPRN
jgi:hypothetical protein